MKSQIEFTDQENQAERTHVAVRDGFCSSGDAYRGCGLLRPAYGEVKDSVAEGDVIYVDETEFPVNSKQYWVWTFVTDDKLLHTVDQNRGSQVLGDVLGEETGIAVKNISTAKYHFRYPTDRYIDITAQYFFRVGYSIKNRTLMVTTKNSSQPFYFDDELDLAQLVADFLEREDNRITADTATSTTTRDVADFWFSKIDTQSWIPLRPTLERVLDEARSVYTDMIRVNGVIPNVSVLADDMLPSVFDNLLKNTIQHNNKYIPTVNLSAKDSAETAEVRIVNNHLGVHDTRKESLFSKSQKRMHSSGTGLGLYPVKTLVEEYDRSVWVKNNSPEGTVFVVGLQKSVQENI